MHTTIFHAGRVPLREVEIDPWGDFSLGRWLWMLTDVQLLARLADGIL